MKAEEQLLLALGDVGDDLIEESMHLRFPRARWLRTLPMVACCALILGAALLLQTLEPLRESQITLPDGDETIQEILPPDQETDTEPDAAPGLRPFYVINLDDDFYGARRAVDQDGNVLAEVEQGELYPLEDQSTGEVLAIAARDRLELDTPGDSPLYLYDLQGELLTTLDAQYIACTGEVVAVVRSTGYELYRRSDGGLLTHGTGTVDLRGDFVLCTDVDLGLCSLYNADGQLAAQFSSDRYDGGLLEWDGQFYFAVAGESGQLGLMDSHGAWVLEPAYEAITALALNRTVVSRNGEFQVVSLGTGETVFTWPYHIYQIHAEGYVVETADGWTQAVDLEGQPVGDPAFRIDLIDDDEDGQAELLAEVHMDQYQVVYRRTDGTPVRTASFEGGELATLSSRVAQFRPDNGNIQYLLNLETGEKITQLAHEYFWMERVKDYDAALLYTASYRGADGELHTDLLNEFGEVVLADICTSITAIHLGDGVFVAYRDGKRVLARVDGTILYESDAPA